MGGNSGGGGGASATLSPTAGKIRERLRELLREREGNAAAMMAAEAQQRERDLQVCTDDLDGV